MENLCGRQQSLISRLRFHVAVKGDVHLIGERLVYNESLILMPMAIPMATVTIAYVRDDDSIQESVSQAHFVRMHH